ncbi:PAS domain-containing sensor histidine kinase [Pedobacter sp. HMWF019]|uniref:PAS domain-containing sensor histidine kinase n=1 Tax=Pedobacter sp. HMWF019 TaxID=2056856 RepID=UPI000D338913|nr:PAS domain-containing sensor histidine kinase [Pedobacter sp. HMWF019]PTS96977.1 PAS domain-containing sensor histidine kinase [Pedobacter sp. HMWF019]
MISKGNNQQPDPKDDFNTALFFNVSQDLMCIAGYDGYFKKINPAVSKLLEYSNEELFSKPINEFVYNDDQVITEKLRDNLKRSIPLLNFENRYLTKSGKVIWLSWTSIPVPEENLVYAIAKNITHKKKQEQERNELVASLSKINEELQHLTHTVSHDLRSPVNNLLSILSLLDVSTIQDQEILGWINLMQSTTEGLKITLNNYLEPVRQKEKNNTPTEGVNISDSLNEVIQSINALVMGSRTVMNVDFSAFETIIFNKVYMDSIFLNLITNSIKYAKPELHPVISISTRNANGLKQLVFSDNGLGFDLNKVQDRVFGLNQTFHHHPDSKGIGLYLIYNHITSLGGHIRVQSEINEGAEFVITFRD